MRRIILLLLAISCGGAIRAQDQIAPSPEEAILSIVFGWQHGLDLGLRDAPEIAALIETEPEKMTEALLQRVPEPEWVNLGQISATERAAIDRTIGLLGLLGTDTARRVLTEWQGAAMAASRSGDNASPDRAERAAYLILDALRPDGSPELSDALLRRWPNMTTRERAQVAGYLAATGRNDAELRAALAEIGPQDAQEKAILDWILERLEEP